eukprot:TRINITY_DN1220_c0_g1_i17.p1 TRINITY_DN1220_c0_g1~~TRINITY_DN1220_c0_g1_i17.p1  ORF type:complete len:913 (-),score=258.07 TRINITY_DN1220_c0_g1_i17:377-3115(-)
MAMSQTEQLFEQLVVHIRGADLYHIQSLLTEHPELVDAQDAQKRTPLHYAAHYGHRKTALAILYFDQNSDKQLLNSDRLNKQDKFRYTALDVAIKEHHTKVALVLRQLGGTSNNLHLINKFFAATLAGDISSMRQLSGMVQDLGITGMDDLKTTLLDARNDRGHTPLILAASVGVKRSVKWLCKNGADRKYRDRVGMTALDYARRSQSRVGHDVIVDILTTDHQLLAAKEHVKDLEEQLKQEQLEKEKLRERIQARISSLLEVEKKDRAAGREFIHSQHLADLRITEASVQGESTFSRQEELDQAKGLLLSEEQRASFDAVEQVHNEGDPLFWKVFLAVQVLLIVLIGCLTKYSDTIRLAAGDSPFSGNPHSVTYAYPSAPTVTNAFPSYAMFQDVHVMIFIGFGFLMTFLRKYSFSSVGLNFVVAAFAVQFHVLVHGMWEHLWKDTTDKKIEVSANSFLLGDFGAAAVLISFGALLGKVTPTQLLVLAMFEINFMVLNELINTQSLKIADMGGSMVVHTFGAYFGLAASWILTPVKSRDNRDPLRDNASVYRSDLFAMIGTLFLWVYWPSFTAAPAPEASQERAQVNTLLALVGSCLSAYIFSSLFRKDHNGQPVYKFDMVDIQNATLAGGVAIGTACDMDLHPGGALTTGCVAGLLSVIGYTKLQPALEERFSLYDTCGVNNLHGMPGVLAGIIGGFATWAAEDGILPECTIAQVWPGRYDTTNANCVTTCGSFACNQTRSVHEQAGYQFLYLFITLATAIAGGLLTGKIVSLLPSPQEYMSDDTAWEVPSYETPFYFDKLSASKLQVGHTETALFDPESEDQSDRRTGTKKAPATQSAPQVADPQLLSHKIDWLMVLAEKERVAQAEAEGKHVDGALKWTPVTIPSAPEPEPPAASQTSDEDSDVSVQM